MNLIRGFEVYAYQSCILAIDSQDLNLLKVSLHPCSMAHCMTYHETAPRFGLHFRNVNVRAGVVDPTFHCILSSPFARSHPASCIGVYSASSRYTSLARNRIRVRIRGKRSGSSERIRGLGPSKIDKKINNQQQSIICESYLSGLNLLTYPFSSTSATSNAEMPNHSISR